jgi:hypothetical protein
LLALLTPMKLLFVLFHDTIYVMLYNIYVVMFENLKQFIDDNNDSGLSNFLSANPNVDKTVLVRALRYATQSASDPVFNTLFNRLRELWDSYTSEELQKLKNVIDSNDDNGLNTLLSHYARLNDEVAKDCADKAVAEAMDYVLQKGNFEYAYTLCEHLFENKSQAGAELMRDVRDGHWNLVKLCLDRYTIADDYLKLAFLWGAAKEGSADVLEILFEKMSDKARVALLVEAAASANMKAVQKVIELQKSCGANINARDDNGNTALIMAAHYFHGDIVRELVLAGANPDVCSIPKNYEYSDPEHPKSAWDSADEKMKQAMQQALKDRVKAIDYPKTQLAACFAFTAIPAGLVLLLTSSLLPVLATAAVGLVGAIVLTMASKDKFNDAACAFYNWLGIAQDEQSTVPSV